MLNELLPPTPARTLTPMYVFRHVSAAMITTPAHANRPPSGYFTISFADISS